MGTFGARWTIKKIQQMAQSTIEWTQLTWNPTTGCDKLTAGCKFCYAEVMSRRLKAMRQEKYLNGFELTIYPESLKTPFEWKKPKTVFVNSMSDLFHKDIPLSFLKKVFKVMNEINNGTLATMGTIVDRIDFLRNTDAYVKFLSFEPLLGPLPDLNLKNINWVIVGGESGHGARPMKYEWVMELKQQCEKAGVLFFFKQWGRPEFNIDPYDPTIDADHPQHAKGGCRLDGEVYREMPVRINL